MMAYFLCCWLFSKSLMKVVLPDPKNPTSKQMLPLPSSEIILLIQCSWNRKYLNQMKFYRNLGPVSFLFEDEDFEVFSALTNTYIWQMKENPHPQLSDLLLQMMTSYQTAFKAYDSIQLYCQEYKSASILIKGVLHQKKHNEVNEICDMILEGIQSVKKMSEITRKFIGKIHKHSFYCVDNRIRCIYLPTKECAGQDFDSTLKTSLIEFINTLVDPKQVSHRLLAKKLTKCTTVHQIQEETCYFLKVYAIKKTPNYSSINNCPENVSSNSNPQFKDTLKKKLQKTNGERNKSHRKLKLFKMVEVSEKSISKASLFVERQLFNSETRKPSSAMHVSLHQKSTSQRQSHMSSSTRSRDLVKNNSRIYPKNKTATLSTFSSTANSFYHKPTQLSSTNYFESSQNQSNHVSKNDQIKFLNLFQEKKQSGNVKHKKSIVKEKQNCSKKTEIDNQNMTKIPELSFLKEDSQKRQKGFYGKTDGSMKQIEICLAGDEKKLKRKVFQKAKEENFGSEIEIIDFEKEKKGNKIVEGKEVGQIETARITFNKATIVEQMVRSEEELLLERKCNLDYIGEAIFNTKMHLKEYDKVFWQLPLFFLYREFYFRRIKLLADFQLTHNLKTSPLKKEILSDNSKIEESAKELLKKVLKKLKKGQSETKEALLAYLNLDESVNCESITKILFKQYLNSILETTNSSADLLTHQIQIIDAYLILQGKIINPKERISCQDEAFAQKYHHQILVKIAPLLN